MPLLISSSLNSSVYFPGDTLFSKIVLSSVSESKADLLLLESTYSSRPIYVANITPIDRNTPQTTSDNNNPINHNTPVNNSNNNNNNSQSNSQENISIFDNYTILWTSAQLHGNFSVDPTVIKLTPSSKNNTKSKVSNANLPSTAGLIFGTALPNMSDVGPNGRSIFASPVSILGCELKIPPTHTFYYHVTLPSILPPTFKGSGIKYTYFLTIAVCVSGGTNAHIFNIPIRVLTPSASISRLSYPQGYPTHNYDEGFIEVREIDLHSKSREVVWRWSGGYESEMTGVTGPNIQVSDDGSDSNSSLQESNSSNNSISMNSPLFSPRISSIYNNNSNSNSSNNSGGGNTNTPNINNSNSNSNSNMYSYIANRNGPSIDYNSLREELTNHPEMWVSIVSRSGSQKYNNFSNNSPHALTPYPQNKSQYDLYHTRNELNALLEKHSKQVTRHITKGQDRLLTFSISKSGFQLGETVAGSLLFYGIIPCYQVSVWLEYVEALDPSITLNVKTNPRTTRRVIGELHEYTLHTLQTHFTFFIPLDAIPEFSTDQISVQWFLHFEFITATQTLVSNSNLTPNTSNSTTTSTPPPNPVTQHNPTPTHGGELGNPKILSQITAQLKLHNDSAQTHTPTTNIDTNTNTSGNSDIITNSSKDSNTTPTSSPPSSPRDSKNISNSKIPPKVITPPSSSLNSSRTIEPAFKKLNMTNNPLVDSLNWTIPIRVFVPSYPHEVLYHTRNSMHNNAK